MEISSLARSLGVQRALESRELDQPASNPQKFQPNSNSLEAFVNPKTPEELDAARKSRARVRGTEAALRRDLKSVRRQSNLDHRNTW